MHNIQKLKKIVDSQNYLLWLFIALIASIFWLLIAKQVHNPKGKEIYILGTDALREMKATENLIHNGVMDFGERDAIFRVPEAHDYTFRMPGFIVLYYPLSAIFGEDSALTLIIIIQLLLYSLSAYLLGKIALILFKKNWTFYFVFFTYLACSFVFQFNFGFAKEGISTSILIISVYLVFDWYCKRKSINLLYYSILMTWLIFLRPFFLPVFVFFNILILFNIRESNLFGFFKILTIVFLPLIIALSAWTIRNYKLTHKIVLLESSWAFSDPFNFENTFQDFNVAIGGNMVYWQKNTSGTWFFPKKILNEWHLEVPPDDVIPDWIYADGLTKDTLLKSRAFFWQSLETSNPLEKQKLLVESQVILKKFIKHIKKEFPFKYYISYRLNALWNLIYKPMGLSLRGLKYPINVVLTFTDTLIKVFVFLIGFLGSFYFLFKIKENYLLWFPLAVIGFLYVFLALFLLDPETRRIAGAYPFLLITATGVLIKIQTFNSKLRFIIYFSGFIILSLLAVNQTISLINW